MNSVTHKVFIYIEYHSVCPHVGIGTLHPPPLSPASAPPPEPKGGAHSPADEGVGKSQFRRLEKKVSTLPTLWCNNYGKPPSKILRCMPQYLQAPNPTKERPRSKELTRGPPEVSSALIGGAHIDARTLHVLNLIWFGNISRLSQWGGGG